METISALIVDDEKLAREELVYLLRELPEIQVVGEAQNVDEATLKVNALKPQLLFLDINMPAQSGFDLLEQLPNPPHVIFVTAYDHHAVQAFETDALAYLVKPLIPAKLHKAVEKVKQALLREQAAGRQANAFDVGSRVFIKDGERCYMVPVQEIFMVESVNNYCKVYFHGHAPLLHRSLQQLEDRLPANLFFRANRKQLINVQNITKIDSYYKGGMLAELNHKHQVEISQRQAVLFKEMMGL
jgi:two-component system, LytTR family, response regulator